MTRFKISYCFILIVSFTFLSFSNKKDKPTSRPNIIYVLADDLGIGDLQCFNPDGKIQSNAIDQLAAEGMRFTDAHTSSAVCTPSRYSIMTGRYCWRTSLKNNVLNGESKALIDEERPTVASVLKQAGYHTAYIGKWHLGWNWAMDNKGVIDFSKPVSRTPLSNGFDYAYGFCASLDMPPYVYVENGKVTAIPHDTTVNTDFQGMWRKGITSPDFVHKEVLPNFFNRAYQYIKEEAEKKEPFFLYLPLPAPHTPILPKAPWKGKSELNPYGDFVLMIDSYIDQLMKVVKDAGIENNTIIVFTSDNGCSPRAKYDELLAKGHNPSYIYRGTKADIFEGGHRVPLIIKWPGKIKPGTQCNQTNCLVDFMATCASIAGVKLSPESAEDSYDMTPLFKNPQSKKYARHSTIHHSINGSFAIRKGDWKLILCPDSGGWSDPVPNSAQAKGLPPIQLYNLKNDIGERTNVYAQYPKIVEELKAEITQQIKNGRSTPGSITKNDGAQDWPQLKWMKESNN